MQDLQTFRETTDAIGYNDKYHPHDVPPNMVQMIQNGYLDSRGINERTGYSLTGNDTGENKPNLGFGILETNTVKHILKINDNSTSTAADLFYWNGSGNWVKVVTLTFTAGLQCSMVQAFGKVYITNGVDVVKSWDGTTLANVAAIPISKYLRWFHNYLWTLNDSTQKSRAHFSNLSAPEVFGGADFLDISANDGDELTATGTIKDDLIFFKNRRTYGFQGWVEAAFTVAVVNEQLTAFGSTSNDNPVTIGNDLIFMSYGGDIPHIRSLKRTQFADTIYGGILTDPIEGTMKGLSKSQLAKCASTFDGRKVLFFVPTGSSTFNDTVLVYDSITTGWAKYTGIYGARACISTVSGKALIYFADSRNSKVYVFDGSYSDNGAAIDFQFISREFEPDFKRKWLWKYIYIQYDESTSAVSNFEVWTHPDSGENWRLEETLSMAPDQHGFPYIFNFNLGASDDRTPRINLPSTVSRNLTVMFKKNDTTNPVSVQHYDLLAKPKPLRYT